MSGKSEMLWRGLALLGFLMGAAALALTLLQMNRGERADARTGEPPAAIARPAAPALAGRTASLSRLLAERRAVARIELAFEANGALGVSCRAESAEGTLAPCFDAEKGAGTWSLSGARLCITAAVLSLARDSCYEVGGQAPNLSLAGPGLLAGTMFLR